MADNNKSAMKASADFVTDRFIPKRTSVGLDVGTGIKPYRDAASLDEAYGGMKKVLNEEWTADEPIGFELMYDHEHQDTHMNILSDGESETTIPHFDAIDQGEWVSERKPLKNLHEGSYVAGANVYFNADYWHSLMQDPSEYESDPLNALISQMSQNGTSEVSTTVQMTAHPISDKKWAKRWSLTHMLFRPFMLQFKFMMWMVQLFGGLVTGRFGDKFVEVFENMMKELGRIGRALIGYSRKDFINKLEYAKQQEHESAQDIAEKDDMIEEFMKQLTGQKHISEGRKSKDTEHFTSELGNAIDLANAKANEHGFVTQIRLVVIGDDKEEVEHQLDMMERTIDDLYSTPEDDATIQQRLRIAPTQDRQQMKQLILDMAQRKTGVDSHGRIRNQYRVRMVHTTRKKPMVMTPSELATIIHIPSEDVTDSSLERGAKQTGGSLPSEYTWTPDDM